MPDINITIEDKKATVEGTPVIICGNSDYTVNFTFDEEWETHETKTARFIYRSDGLERFQEVVFSGSTCAVPKLFRTEQVSIGVYAGDLQTTTPAEVACECGILCNQPVHQDPPEDVYAQLLKAYDGKQDKLTAGDNITISEEGVISAAGGGGTGGGDEGSDKAKTWSGTTAPTSGPANAYEGVKSGDLYTDETNNILYRAFVYTPKNAPYSIVVWSEVANKEDVVATLNGFALPNVSDVQSVRTAKKNDLYHCDTDHSVWVYAQNDANDKEPWKKIYPVAANGYSKEEIDAKFEEVIGDINTVLASVVGGVE